MEKELEILRGYELRLLRCTLSSPPSDDQTTSHHHHHHHLQLHINHILSLIEAGNYLQALSSDTAQLVLHLPDEDSDDFTDSTESAHPPSLLRIVSASRIFFGKRLCGRF